MANDYCNLIPTKKISEDFQNITIGFDRVQQDMRSNQTNISDHIANKTIHVTQADKDDWNSKAPGSTQTELDDHINDKVVHVTQAEHEKLDGIQEGAEVNQNAFSKINNVEAGTKTDSITIKGGTGISVTSNPLSKEVEITATGEAAPGPHAETHLEFGSDPIPLATETDGGLMSAADKLALNQANAGITQVQNDVIDLQDEVGGLNQSVAAHIADSVQEDEVHGMRVSDGQFQFFNGSKWEGIKSGVEATTKNINYYVSPTGSDSNDGLTAQTAFRTIGHAISLIPQIVNHNVYIRPEPGTYDEAVRLTGYIGSGRISVLGSSTLGKTHNVKLIDIKKCSCDIEVRGFNITQATNGTFEISISGCSSVFLTYIYSDIVSSHGIDFANSFGHISDSLISNKTGTGIRASNFSTLGSYRNTGNNNGVALSSVTVSTIGKLGSQPSGTTAEGTATGGVIR